MRGILSLVSGYSLKTSSLHSIMRRQFSQTNYYSLLGVKSDSTTQEIKRAYYSLAQKLHPDVNQDRNAGTTFAQINNAYQILSDEQKRREYDKDQTEDQQNQQYYNQQQQQQQNSDINGRRSGYSTKGNHQGGGEGFQFEDLFSFDEELFKDFVQSKSKGNQKTTKNYGTDQKKNKYVYEDMEFDFIEEDEVSQFFKQQKTSKKAEGTSFNNSKKKKGADINATTHITFEESLQGCSKTIEVDKKIICDKCNGTKKAVGAKKKLCKSCKGSGFVKIQQGMYVWEFICESCSGLGHLIDQPCKHCSAIGYITKATKETIHIPRGINHSQTLKFPNQGSVSDKGGSPGDLLVKIKIENGKQFRKEGFDVFTEHFISPARAVFGGKIKIKSTKGDLDISIPEGIQDGHKIKLTGYGVEREASKESGDHFVIIRISIPKKLSPEQKAAYQELLNLE